MCLAVHLKFQVYKFQISAGYGKGSHGTQIVGWKDISSIKAVSKVDTGNDPLGLRLLEHFTGIKCNMAKMFCWEM